MSGVDILIAVNLPLYRDVLASMFRAKRPDLVVHSVSDEHLDAAVATMRPALVICSELSQTVIDHCPAWIILFPDQRDEAIVTIAGEQKVLPHAGISELLDILGDVYVSEKIFTQKGDVT